MENMRSDMNRFFTTSFTPMVGELTDDLTENEIVADGIKVNYKNGVLDIRIPNSGENCKRINVEFN